MAEAPDLVLSVNEALRSLSEAVNGKVMDGTSNKGCFGELASVCERVRSDDNFIKIVNELRPSEAASRRSGGQASPSTAAEPPLDPKLAASLDAMFGVSVGMPAPITDIVTVFKGDPVPDGFVKVSKSVAGSFDADLNKGSGGRPVFLCVARRPAAAPITAIAVVFGASGEFFPPGFQPIKHAASGNPANFNAGTAGHEICVGVFRGLGSPVVEIGVWFPDRVVKPSSVAEKLAPGHFVLKRTVLGQMANLNSSTRGSPVHITIRKDLSHVYSLFTGWKSLSTLDVRRTSVATLDVTPIEKSESSRFAGHALSDAEGDAVIEPSVSGSGSKTELETPQLEPAVATTLNDELDTDWAVVGEGDYKAAGRYSWIFPEDVDLVGTATAQSAALATIVLGLYHTRVAVVSASLVQLEQLIRHGWFNNENWSRTSSSAAGGPEEDNLSNYGSLLLEVAIASAADAVSTRPDLLHGQLSTLIITFFRKCGVDAASPAQFGLQPMSLYRCVEVILRMHFFFSRKKLYTGRLARWAEASGRLRDLESLKKNFEGARRDAVSSRASLSELLKVLILGVEAEFAPLFPSEDPQHRGDTATLSALISPFKSLIRWFRTSDSASPTFCCRIHVAAASVISVWARGMADRGVTTLSRYYSGNPHELRSSALDVLVTLAIVCKIASLPLQVDSDGNPRSVSDLQTKVAVLQLCGESVAVAGEAFKHISPLSYFIRRIVCPAILLNCTESRIMLPSIFKAVLGCITAMWTHFRQSLKPELAVLAHVVMLRTMSSPQSLPQQKSDVLAELRSWIQVPQDLVEMYLNFDNDAPYNHMRLVYQLFHSLTAIACGSLNNLRIEGSDTSEAHEELYVSAALALQRDAIDVLCNIIRSVMDAAATVHLISMDSKARKLSEVNWQWEGAASRSLESPASAPQLSRESSVITRHLSKKQLDELLLEGIELCNTKGVGKGLKKLIADGYLSRSPADVVAFLRLCGDRLSAREIGDFLGDIGRGAEEEEWYKQIRATYMAGLDFTGMPFDVALRHLLSNAGFFLPGEAQKIDRITQAFARAYCESNTFDDDVAAMDPDAPVDPRLYKLSSSDVGEVLTFSLIMLHTDAHNPNIKKEKKMTMQQFVSNNRGIDGGKNLPKEFLEYLYTSTVTHEIKMLHGAASGEGKSASAATYVSEMTSAIHLALAHLCSLASDSSVHRKNFSRDIVACMLEDLWPDVMQALQYLLIDRHDPVATEPAIAAVTLNMLKYASSACLFLGLSDQIAAIGGILESVETRIMGSASQPWQRVEGGVDSIVASVHLKMAEIAETAAEQSDAQNLRETAARFKQPFRKELEAVPTRRVLFEGNLTKVCSNGRGKQKRYRFFLFTDLLVYASTGAFSSMYTMHGCIGLESVSFADSPAELASIAHSFKLTSDKKTIFLFADTEEEHMAWRRRIREAVRMIRLSSNATTPEADHETAHDAAADSSGAGDATRADGIGMDEPSTYAFIGAVVPPVAESPRAVVGTTSFVEAAPAAAFASPSNRAVSPGTTNALPVFPARIRGLASKELKDMFRAALEHSRPLLQAPSASAAASPPGAPLALSDLQKLQFYGYFKQATKGDLHSSAPSNPASSAADLAKLEAWRKCHGLSRRDAMRAFVYLMCQADPDWEKRPSLETVPEMLPSSP